MLKPPVLVSAPPAWTAQSMAPDAVTCITKASALPWRMSDVEPNDATEDAFEIDVAPK
jgi:hypothetical protein